MGKKKQIIIDTPFEATVTLPLPDESGGRYTVALIDEDDLPDIKKEFKVGKVKEIKDKEWKDIPEKYKKDGQAGHEFWGISSDPDPDPVDLEPEPEPDPFLEPEPDPKTKKTDQ